MLLNVLPKVSKDICKPSQSITIWNSNIICFFCHGQIVLYRLNAMMGNVKMVQWQMALFVIVIRVLNVVEGENALKYVTLVIIVSIRSH
jgi:hypothetical protein